MGVGSRGVEVDIGRGVAMGGPDGAGGFEGTGARMQVMDWSCGLNTLCELMDSFAEVDRRSFGGAWCVLVLAWREGKPVGLKRRLFLQGWDGPRQTGGCRLRTCGLLRLLVCSSGHTLTQFAKASSCGSSYNIQSFEYSKNNEPSPFSLSR